MEAVFGDSFGSPTGGGANWKMLGDLAAENLGGSDKADFFTAKATIVFSRKENALYMVLAIR